MTLEQPPPMPSGTNRPTPPPSPRRGLPGCVVLLISLGIAGIVAASVFAAFLIAGMVSGGLLGAPARTRTYHEELIEPSGSGNKIAVIRVEGMLISGEERSIWAPMVTAGSIRAQLDKAEYDPDVVAVILDINSPGGEVVACDEIHQRIRQFRDATGRPVIACMRSMAASGGYYIAAPTDHIVANRMTLTGSIGVIMPGYDYSELLQEKLGIKPQTYKQGQMKDMGSGARSPSDTEAALLQGLVDHIYQEFTAIVAEGRGLDLEDFRNGPAGDSRILSGAEALDLRLVDELGFFEDAVAAARRLAGDPQAGVVLYRYRLSPLELLTSAQAQPQADLGALLPVRGVQVKKGHPYLLCPGTF